MKTQLESRIIMFFIKVYSSAGENIFGRKSRSGEGQFLEQPGGLLDCPDANG
jgi:hypothetical protein